jgi:tRNA (guanine37-N1)-methyltransferase
MRIDIITLFPNMFAGPFAESIIGRAIEHHLVTIVVHDLRDYGLGKHRVVDDRPYGGGPGMVLKPEPLFELVERIKGGDRVPVILLSPQGRLFSQKVAWELATHEQLVLICGHYEGVDERIREHLVSDEVSIGDYVLTGGELAAMVVVDAVVRLLPGVLGSEESPKDDSHASGLLGYPQYTRPHVYRGWAVPQVLLSGNHSQVADWRREQSLLRTLARRPDLLEKADLSAEERRFIETMKR